MDSNHQRSGRRGNSVRSAIRHVDSLLTFTGGLLVGFLQIDDAWNNIYTRTSAFGTLILSLASLTAGGIFIVTVSNLDSISKLPISTESNASNLDFIPSSVVIVWLVVPFYRVCRFLG